MVIKKLTPSEEDGNTDIDSALQETLPKIKEAAVTYKKTSISEADN